MANQVQIGGTVQGGAGTPGAGRNVLGFKSFRLAQILSAARNIDPALTDCSTALDTWTKMASFILVDQNLISKIRRSVVAGGESGAWGEWFQAIRASYYETLASPFAGDFTKLLAWVFAGLAAARSVAIEAGCLPWVSCESDLARVKTEFKRLRAQV